jgi:hypothetical protein
VTRAPDIAIGEIAGPIHLKMEVCNHGKEAKREIDLSAQREILEIRIFQSAVQWALLK